MGSRGRNSSQKIISKSALPLMPDMPPSSHPLHGPSGGSPFSILRLDPASLPLRSQPFKTHRIDTASASAQANERHVARRVNSPHRALCLGGACLPACKGSFLFARKEARRSPVIQEAENLSPPRLLLPNGKRGYKTWSAGFDGQVIVSMFLYRCTKAMLFQKKWRTLRLSKVSFSSEITIGFSAISSSAYPRHQCMA